MTQLSVARDRQTISLHDSCRGMIHHCDPRRTLWTVGFLSLWGRMSAIMLSWEPSKRLLSFDPKPLVKESCRRIWLRHRSEVVLSVTVLVIMMNRLIYLIEESIYGFLGLLEIRKISRYGRIVGLKLIGSP